MASFFVRNESTLDRATRVLAGVALIGAVFFGPQTPWGWLGLIPLATGLVGFCPLYRLLGISTCHKYKAPSDEEIMEHIRDSAAPPDPAG